MKCCACLENNILQIWN